MARRYRNRRYSRRRYSRRRYSRRRGRRGSSQSTMYSLIAAGFAVVAYFGFTQGWFDGIRAKLVS